MRTVLILMLVIATAMAAPEPGDWVEVDMAPIDMLDEVYTGRVIDFQDGLLCIECYKSSWKLRNGTYYDFPMNGTEICLGSAYIYNVWVW
jgi:hypothetical protein